MLPILLSNGKESDYFNLNLGAAKLRGSYVYIYYLTSDGVRSRITDIKLSNFAYDEVPKYNPKNLVLPVATNDQKNEPTAAAILRIFGAPRPTDLLTVLPVMGPLIFFGSRVFSPPSDERVNCIPTRLAINRVFDVTCHRITSIGTSYCDDNEKWEMGHSFMSIYEKELEFFNKQFSTEKYKEKIKRSQSFDLDEFCAACKEKISAENGYKFGYKKLSALEGCYFACRNAYVAQKNHL